MKTFIKYLWGMDYKKINWKELSIHCGDTNLENYDDAIVTYMEYFKIHCMYKVKVACYDGICDMLDFFKEK